MNAAPSAKPAKFRQGLALGLVVLLAVVVLAVGSLMLANSGTLLRNTADAKSRLRARYAAEGMIALQMARLDGSKDMSFGSNLNMADVSTMDLGTGNGEKAESHPIREEQGRGQATITSGALRGLKGLKMPFLIQATGYAGGGARSKISADVYLYQVPIFQYGVFFDGDLEVTPGPAMSVQGPVHTNGNAYFRGYLGRSLTFEGPVTVSGTLYHWIQPGGGIYYYPAPETPATTAQSGLGNTMAAMTDATRPVAVNGVYNVQHGTEKLTLPIGGTTPRALILPCDGTESSSLKRQRFACLQGAKSYIEGTSAIPPYLGPQTVFFDRREKRWVKFRDFDVAQALLGNPRDSIFYLYDPTSSVDRGSNGVGVINAFRIKGAILPRNVSIVSGNPVYILGDFNLPSATSTCGPAGVSSPPASDRYCNAMIASDAVTLLSPAWSNNNWSARSATGDPMMGTLERPFSDAAWTIGRQWESKPQLFVSRPPFSSAVTEVSNIEQPWGVPGLSGNSTAGYTSARFAGTITINAAILTGCKPTNPSFLAPANSDDGIYNSNTEGGWIGTLRFLEDLTDATVVFKGSFVCLWNSASPGLDMSANHSFNTFSMRTQWGKLLPYSWVGSFTPPARTWGFDPRFKELDNMPPGTPFLSTGIHSNWSEPR